MTDHPYGFGGEEETNELDINTIAYQWREYDPAIGRFNKIDRFAEKYQNLSPYHYAGNNPIRLRDIKGDSVSGMSRKDARKARRLIRKNFKGKNKKLRRLFNTRGLGFKKVSDKKLARLTKGTDKEASKLAKAFIQAINSDNMHRVEVVRREDELSSFTKEKTVPGLILGAKTGADINKHHGGGLNVLDFDGGTVTIIIENSLHSVPIIDTKTNTIVAMESNLSSTLSHELLGHGVGRMIGSSGAEHVDAIQMSNLSLRVQGVGRYQRNGHAHQENGTLSSSTYSGIPTHFDF